MSDHEPCDTCGRPMQFDEGWFCTGSISCGVDLVDERDQLRKALRRAYDHLRFHAWKDDPHGDKRFFAVQEIRDALGLNEEVNAAR